MQLPNTAVTTLTADTIVMITHDAILHESPSAADSDCIPEQLMHFPPITGL
jgi:hypothetical protein